MGDVAVATSAAISTAKATASFMCVEFPLRPIDYWFFFLLCVGHFSPQLSKFNSPKLDLNLELN